MNGFDRRAFLAWVSGGLVAAAGIGRGGAISAAAAEHATDGALVLRGATVLDGTGGPALPDTSIVCAGDRIVAVGRWEELPGIAGMRVVDCRGKFVLPGLWDLHGHSAEITPTVPALHLVHGVTGVREMRGSAATHDVRRRIERGELAGPRLVVASNTLDGPDSPVPGATIIDGDDAARRAVDQAVRDGADVLKVYSFLHGDEHAAIAAHAARVGLPFAGHSPSLLPVQEVVRQGQHSIEHNYGMHLSTSEHADDYFRRLAGLPDDPADPQWWGAQAPLWEREAFRTYSPVRAADLAGLLTEHGAWHVPTFAVESAYARHPSRFLDDEPTQELARRLLPPDLRQAWREQVEAWPEWSEERAETELAYFDARLRLVGDLVAAGAGIGTGTDAGTAYVFPGLALHDELELLVDAGLSPQRVLRAATRDSARCAGVPDAGTVAAGQLADLLVLNADPLADIANTRTIHSVLTQGTYLGPAERRRLFEEIERAATEPASADVSRSLSCCAPPSRGVSSPL